MISSGEGGSSDVAVKLLGCVRVQLSEGRRKQEIKRKAVLKGQGERTESVSETDLCRAHRGQTDGQTWRAARRKNTKRNYYGTSNER